MVIVVTGRFALLMVLVAAGFGTVGCLNRLFEMSTWSRLVSLVAATKGISITVGAAADHGINTIGQHAIGPQVSFPDNETINADPDGTPMGCNCEEHGQQGGHGQTYDLTSW